MGRKTDTLISCMDILYAVSFMFTSSSALKLRNYSVL
jgi:hypothetical protein